MRHYSTIDATATDCRRKETTMGSNRQVHYDKDLSGVAACGRQNYDHAHEDISQVTCKDCLRVAQRIADEARAALGQDGESSQNQGLST